MVDEAPASGRPHAGTEKGGGGVVGAATTAEGGEVVPRAGGATKRGGDGAAGFVPPCWVARTVETPGFYNGGRNNSCTRNEDHDLSRASKRQQPRREG